MPGSRARVLRSGMVTALIPSLSGNENLPQRDPLRPSPNRLIF